ncbi:hypothetical protein Q5424_08670, partial [Conexibacter sp. JD483]
VARRAARRPRRLRLPEALLVAVTSDRVLLLQARSAPGGGPVPVAAAVLASWERARTEITVTPDVHGTRLTLRPRGGGRVELLGPPDALSARVVTALRQPELVPSV